MSDAVQTVAITGFFAVILAAVPIVSAWILRISAREDARLAREDAKQAQNDAKDAANAAKVAKEEVQKVAETLATTNTVQSEKLDVLVKVADATHVLVNSNMGVQLKISAVALRRVAELTNHSDDIAAADLADKLFKGHVEKQAQVDKAKP